MKKRKFRNPEDIDWSKLNKGPSLWTRFKDWTLNWWNHFWYEYHHNGIYGPGGQSTREFREGRLGLVISIVPIILLILYFILF
jgi:hypothetical protein